MALTLSRRVARLRAEFVRLDKAGYLRLLTTEEWLPGAIPHVWLANLGVIEEPGQEVRDALRRLADEEERRRSETAADGGGEAAAQQMSEEECDCMLAAALWDYFRMPFVPECFGTPGGERKLLDWTREKLGLPDLTAADAQKVVGKRAEALWAEMDRRSGEAPDGADPPTQRGATAEV